jgi:hypothetical protein
MRIFCKPWILQRLDLHMYVDVILFVMCKENHTICNAYINLTQTMFGSCKQRSSLIYNDKYLLSPLQLVVTVLKWNNIKLVGQTTLARLLSLVENVCVQIQLLTGASKLSYPFPLILLQKLVISIKCVLK